MSIPERTPIEYQLFTDTNSLKICRILSPVLKLGYVGGLRHGHPADTRTEAQKRALEWLLRRLKREYPGAVVHGHRDFARKACPCFDATSEYANLKSEEGV